MISRTTSTANDYSIFDNKHTPNSPYCSDLDCSCHINVTYHAQVIEPRCTDQGYTIALAFFGLAQGGARND